LRKAGQSGKSARLTISIRTPSESMKFANTEQLDRLLTAIVNAVSAEYGATAGTRKNRRRTR
jgi:hypothetical protein